MRCGENNYDGERIERAIVAPLRRPSSRFTYVTTDQGLRNTICQYTIEEKETQGSPMNSCSIRTSDGDWLFARSSPKANMVISDATR